MDQVIKQRWLTALRSGEYPQITGVLHNDEGFCCLGVLSELAHKDGVVTRTRTNDDYYAYGSEKAAGVLPAEVINWAGLEEPVPVVLLTLRQDAGDEVVYGLADLNDGEGWTFDEIADVIEEQL